MKTRVGMIAMIFFVSLFFVVVSSPAFARAGGGGGKGGGAVGIFGAILYGIYYAFWMLFIEWRKGRAKRLLERIEKVDSKWNLKAIEERVTAVYFQVQSAWANGQMDQAASCLSVAENNRLQKMLEVDRLSGTKNFLEKIALTSVECIGVSDQNGQNDDEVFVLIHGSMVDYTMNLKTKELVLKAGQSEDEAVQESPFYEVWTFRWNGSAWALSEISDATGIIDTFALPCESNDCDYWRVKKQSI